MEHVSIVGGHDGETGIAAAAQARFDFEALLPTPIPGEFPPVVGQFGSAQDAASPSQPGLQLHPDLAPDTEPDTEPERARTPFGAWLLAQDRRKGWIGELAKAAKTDRAFPKTGSPDDVRRRLQDLGADGDVFEALDDAELDWASF